jgi:hypothetical protein
VYLVYIEVYTGQIGGVMPHATEVFDTVIAAHIPPDVVGVTHHNLGYRRCPRPATNNRYLTTVVHFFFIF